MTESFTHSAGRAQALRADASRVKRGASPSLVSRDITGHFPVTGRNDGKKTGPLSLAAVVAKSDEWLHELEEATEQHRLARRAHHVAEAERAGEGIRELLRTWGVGDARRKRRALPSTDELPEGRERAALAAAAKQLTEIEDDIAHELEASLAPRELRESDVGRAAFQNTLAGVDGRGGLVNRARWHLGRAKGQARRFSDVRTCGEGGGAIVRACGGSSVFCHTCRIGRVCVSCRAHAALERRARFGRGRVYALKEAARAGLFRHGRVPLADGGGTWGERHLTLTAPHTKNAGESISSMFEAWRHFSRAFQRWTRSKAFRGVHGYHRPDYWRAFEWTPGADGKGHPHFHVWMLSPFLPVKKLLQWWKKGLEKAGYDVTPESYVRIDIRMIRTPSGDFGRELFKFQNAIRMSELEVVGEGGNAVQAYADGWTLTEEYKPKHGGKAVRIPPELAARVYEALEARRLAQSSRRFASTEPERKPCRYCGTDGCGVRIALVKPGPQYHERLIAAMHRASQRWAEDGRPPLPD